MCERFVSNRAGARRVIHRRVSAVRVHLFTRAFAFSAVGIEELCELSRGPCYLVDLNGDRASSLREESVIVELRKKTENYSVNNARKANDRND